MVDFLKDILKAAIQGIFSIMLPIALVIGGAALFGFGLDNDWRILAWIGGGLLVAGLVWGALLYMMHG